MKKLMMGLVLAGVLAMGGAGCRDGERDATGPGAETIAAQEDPVAVVKGFVDLLGKGDAERILAEVKVLKLTDPQLSEEAVEKDVAEVVKVYSNAKLDAIKIRKVEPEIGKLPEGVTIVSASLTLTSGKKASLVFCLKRKDGLWSNWLYTDESRAFLVGKLCDDIVNASDDEEDEEDDDDSDEDEEDDEEDSDDDSDEDEEEDEDDGLCASV